jgi:TPR repeat protein
MTDMTRLMALVMALLLASGPVLAEIKVANKSRVEAEPVLASTGPSTPASLESAGSKDSACDSQAAIEGSSVRSNTAQRAPRLDEALAARARAGDASAAWRAALASFRGECRAPNYSEMAAYVQIAHQAGHACATGALGLMTARGWGLQRDMPQARELIERSIQAGCSRAQYWSWLADESAPNPGARERARSYLAQGADRNDGHALNALAVLRESEGQRDDARKLYLRAANAGNATARQNLARLARYFSQSTEKPSIASLQRRATGGEAQAQYLLARRFHQGDGISPNYVQALKWYEQAAAKGNAAAREMMQLVQARLGNVAMAQPMNANLALMSDLAYVDLAQDELNKKRGITQPIEDTDPFTLL